MLASMLIVDDYVESLDILKELFSMGGRDVRVAASGREAMDMMDAEPASIIWIDEDLYDFRGSDLAFHLKAVAEKRNPGAPCITIAVRGDMNSALEESLPWFDYAVSKPVNYDKVDALLARCDAALTAHSSKS